MSDFLMTKMGKRFIDGTMPEIADALKRIADALEENNRLLVQAEKNKTACDEEMLSLCGKYAKMHGTFPQMTDYQCETMPYFKECIRTAISSGLPLESYLHRKHEDEDATDQAAKCTADEIKKYKELLDIGVITQEEFDSHVRKNHQ